MQKKNYYKNKYINKYTYRRKYIFEAFNKEY